MIQFARWPTGMSTRRGPERARRLPARARMRTSHTKRCPAKTSEERLKIVIGGLCNRGGRLPPLLCTKSTPWLGYRPAICRRCICVKEIGGVVKNIWEVAAFAFYEAFCKEYNTIL